MYQRRPVLTFLTGLLGGVCLSLLTGMGLFYSYVTQTLRPNSTPIERPVNILLTATWQPMPSQTSPFDEAETALNAGQPEKVKELLYPAIESWTSNEDRVKGYKLLGEAELMQGHAQLAVPYFEKLYFYEPSAENLFLLATTYDFGGDNKSALSKYQELANWENLPPEIDVEFIDSRVYDISRALGTPVPTHTPLP